jgi:hypothetical protein
VFRFETPETLQFLRLYITGDEQPLFHQKIETNRNPKHNAILSEKISDFTVIWLQSVITAQQKAQNNVTNFANSNKFSNFTER